MTTFEERHGRPKPPKIYTHAEAIAYAQQQAERSPRNALVQGR